MSEHTPGFYNALRQHNCRVRSLRRLPAQYLRVAWAVSERFSSIHAIAFASMADYGTLAGNVDRRDVSRALAALMAADCIRPVPHDELVSILGPSPSGRSPRGFRMVIDLGADVTPEMASLVYQAPPADPDRRFSARSVRAKGHEPIGGTVPPQMPVGLADRSGGTVPPEGRTMAAGDDQGTSGGRNAEFWGHSARPIDKLIGEGAAPDGARAYTPEPSVKPLSKAGAPQGARHQQLDDLITEKFGEVGAVGRERIGVLVTIIGLVETIERLSDASPMRSAANWVAAQSEMALPDDLDEEAN